MGYTLNIIHLKFAKIIQANNNRPIKHAEKSK